MSEVGLAGPSQLSVSHGPDLVAEPPVTNRHRLGFDAALVVACSSVVAALAVARSGVGYWIDEGITVGIAGRPATAIPGILRQDGNPPAYYELLHLWIRLFGTSPVATHLLSAVTVTAFVPVLWWAADRLIGRTEARIAAVVSIGCPFLAWYGAETRMYALTALVALVATTSFLCWHRSRSVGWWLASVLSAALLLWVHDWGVYVVFALLVTGVLAWAHGDLTDRRTQTSRRPQNRAAGRDWHGLGSLLGWAVAVGALWLPWVPNFLFQARHTGAPWAVTPPAIDLVETPLRVLAGPAWVTMGSLALVAGVLTLVSRGKRTDDAGTGRQPVGDLRTGSVLWQLGVVVLVTVVVGWLGGRAESSWNERYLGVMLGPLLVLVAAAFAGWRIPRALGFVATVVALTSTVASVVVTPGSGVDLKSNIATTARSLHSVVAPGDVVVATETSELPVIAHYLGSGPRYANPMGPAVSYVVDWVDLTGRLAKADPELQISRLTQQLRPGGHLIVIGPPNWPSHPEGVYNREVTAMGERTIAAARHQPQLELIETLGSPSSQPPYPVSALVFVKR